MRLQLDPDDDEAERSARMSVERRMELEMRRALDDMLNTLFPEGYGDFVNPQIEANRIHDAFLRDQALRDTISRAIQDSSDLGVSVAVKQFENIGYGFDYTLANVAARDWALRHTDTLLRQLGTTSGSIVGQAVGRWVDNGEPLPSLIRDLEPAFGKKRAKLIAATEVTRAYAQGTVETYKASGVVKKLVWLTANDERRCIFCGGLHEKVVGIETSFDEALPAALREKTKPFALPPAHPGCILPGNLISAPAGIDAMAKSFYVGRCVEVTLSDGGSFTVTKNHPVLTPAGWVDAQFLNQDMYVFSAMDSNRIATAINPDDQNVPTAIEQVFNSFVESGEVSTVSVPAAAEDLHGEGDFIQGNIDIVYTNRLLMANSIAKGFDVLSQEAFAQDDTRHGNLLRPGIPGSFVDSHLSPFGDSVGVGEHGSLTHLVGDCPACGHAFGSPADVNAGFLQPTPKSGATNAYFGTEMLFGLASYIASNIGINIGDAYSPTQHGETGSLQLSPDGIGTDTSLASEFIDRFASEVTLTQVVNVREFDFSGHVYDLQSDMYQLYICNGVLVKNCRCWIVAEVEEPKRRRGNV